MEYNTEKIKRDITMRQAALIAGIPVTGNMINCPSHADNIGKLDKNRSNCQLNKHYFYCHACKASGDLFKMIKDYHKHYFGNVLSFQDICSMLVSQMDNPKEYIVEDKSPTSYQQKRKKEELKPFPLSEEVMKMIGIKKESSFIAIPDGVTFSKKEIPQDKEIIKDMDTSDENCPYVFGHTVAAPSISSIFHEDEEAFWSIVTPRLFDAKEMIEQNKIYFDKKDYHFMGEKLAEAFISYYGYIGEKKEQEKWKQALQKHQLSAMFDIKIMRASKNPY